MMTKTRLVIIGAGMASGRLLEHLTAAAPEAFDITLFNAEPRGTYNRIMLSPVLAGDKSFAEIVTHDDAWYAARHVTCRFGECVQRIDREAKVVIGEKGEVSYDKLVIATGSTPFIIPLPGHDLDGVIAYRDLDDTKRMIDAASKPGARAVVIGGGLLGLEAAAGLRLRGMDVSVVHLAGHLMERQLDETAGHMLKASLEAKGIDVLLEASSQEILGHNGHVRALKLADGRELPCNLLVMAVGIRPNVALARDAGLKIGRGIEVDDHLVSSDPSILALGECVEHRGALFGLVAPLYDQAKVLAETLVGNSACFTQSSLATKLKVTGCDLFSAGDFSDAPGRENIVYRDPRRGIYKRLIIEGERLVGAVMYGDTADGNWFFGLIKDGTRIGPFRETLIFGPSPHGGGEGDLDPFSAVAAWSPETEICGSNGLREKQITFCLPCQHSNHPSDNEVTSAQLSGEPEATSAVAVAATSPGRAAPCKGVL